MPARPAPAPILLVALGPDLPDVYLTAAVRQVDRHATDDTDREQLLDALGLTDTPTED